MSKKRRKITKAKRIPNRKTKKKVFNEIKRLKAEQKKCIEELGKTDDLPFIIHACPPEEIPPFPAHTHGLTEMGMPEFIIDPYSFGPKGNCHLINAVFDYFAKPKNRDKMTEILDGKTIRLTSKDLKPDSTEDYVYCLREVSHDFEAVKIAYPAGDNLGHDISNARVVQIWVEGDDYVLQDAYYKGGIMW